MPFKITFDNIPAGFCLNTARPGEMADVVLREFTSSEDGDLFISRLEGMGGQVLPLLQKQANIIVRPSSIDHLLAVISRDKTADIFINELDIRCEFVTKRDLKAGEPVSTDDIADIRRMVFEGLDIPVDAGIIFIFSAGWRKGLFYDLGPAQPFQPITRTYDLSVYLGQMYSYLSFQDIFKISDDEWEKLLENKWFPFITLKGRTIRQMLNHNRENLDIDEILPTVKDELVDRLPKLIEKFENNPIFEGHVEILKSAADRYIAEDFISSISTLFPRIEGVMRSFYLLKSPTQKATQKSLVDTAVTQSEPASRPFSLLLPKRFQQYMFDVYFASFDPNGDKPLSRHSIAHGVANPMEFSLKAATLGFLVLDQLSIYLREEPPTSQEA